MVIHKNNRKTQGIGEFLESLQGMPSNVILGDSSVERKIYRYLVRYRRANIKQTIEKNRGTWLEYEFIEILAIAK